MKQPDISCVIPTLNCAWCIGETLQSIAGQAGTSARILVVDSDSTDDTLNICARFGVEVVTEPRGNLYRAINAGLRRCETEWVAYTLYVGHRTGYKNFLRFVQAYASSAFLRTEFEIIAFGGPGFSAQEASELERLGIRDRVRHQSGSDDDLIARYKTATVFVYPSLYEGFGIPPLEAMSWSCPVACSNGGSLPEVVAEAGIYFDPYSIEGIRSAVGRIVMTPSLQTELRGRGHLRIRNFSWDRCAAETLEVYRSLC